jgi:hypothetical protein
MNIIELATQAGMEQDGDMWFSDSDINSDVHISHLEAFAELVAAHEREECAKLCEEAHWSLDDRAEYAAAIRARSNT